MKINLSKIFRYILITLINILTIFVLQYYINLQSNISSSLSDLKVAIFVNNPISDIDKEENFDNVEDQISEISSNDKLKIVESVNSADSEKFDEINSEINGTIPKESITFPSFLLANITNINSLKELESLENEILSIENVEDFVYDRKAYKMFFDNRELLNKYKKVFNFIFFIIIFLFVLKFLFFVIKSLYREILIEIAGGVLISLCAYAIICLVTVFNQSNMFILSGQVLYIVMPLSSMLTLLTKESNA